MTKARVPVVDGLFREEPDGSARLLGGRCPSCGGSFFPKQWSFCRNPRCGGTTLEDVDLSTRGTLWSFTDNRYAPPPPYPATEPFESYGVAAVELAEEQMVVLGQLATGAEPDRLEVGMEMELVLGPLYEDDEHEYVVWQWAPLQGAPR